MKVIVRTEEVRGEQGGSEKREFSQAVVKYQKTVMRLPPGKNVSALGVLTGEPEQLWLSVAGGSYSSLFCFNDSSVDPVCNTSMYVTDILPIDPNLILLAGSSSGHSQVEIWSTSGRLPIQIARFVRPVGGGNPDTGQAAYPTFGIDGQRLFVGWRLRKKGGTKVEADALNIPALVPFFQPIEPFDLVPALIGAGIDTQRLLETVDEQNFYRQLYI